MLNEKLREMIETRHGRKLNYSQECEALSESIFQATGERLSMATLKRLFGFVGLQVTPRRSTMDIIAQYVGYPNYQILAKEIGDDTDISDFTPVDEVVSAETDEGTQVQISYEPGRVLVLTYIGNGYYIVNESQKSKLLKGDKIKVSHLRLGGELVVQEVIRDGKNLGSYTGAKQGGLTSIEIIG